jgi:uroporphyrin-III C-methyltransferase/precorrin-2 dehydrogenase/sirohydrochlorin ferrochelatase
MDNFPIFLEIKNKPVLVIGGGDIALRKIKLLIKSKPNLKVVAKNFCEEILDLKDRYSIDIIQKDFHPDDIEFPIIIIAATNNKLLNKQIAQIGGKKKIPVNVVDQPALCTFTMGSIVERGSLVVSISSSGKAPVLVRQLREKIEMMIPDAYKDLVDLAGSLRDKVKKSIKINNKRRIFWEKFFDVENIQSFLNQNKTLTKKFNSLLRSMKNNTGEVYLVGAGPGERDLLTIRALHLMQKCDVCIFDNLVSDEVIELVRRDADMIFAGKKRDQHTFSQEKINDLLVKYAKKGKKVLRLKGGDPFIFGRGGEEIESLMSHKINFQVVPGISAANGVAAYAGIPLTHRDYAQSCLFLTGHFKDGKIDFDWPKLVTEKQTLVIYMGLLSLPDFIKELIEHGQNKTMPVAVIQSGTTSAQRVIVGNIGNIKNKLVRSKIKSPALVIIGEVVKLRDQLKWFK